jgi:hypothetical protein
MLPDTPLAFFRLGSNARNGLSLARNGYLSRDSRPGVNVPGLLLHITAGLLPPPVRPFAPLPKPVRPGYGRFHAQARCSFHNPTHRLRFSWSLPVRGFRPFRISVSTRSLPVDPPSELARSPFAPHSRFLSLVMAAADQRSRSATFPEACCSSNLLEPHSLCSRMPRQSTARSPKRADFLRLYFICLYAVTPAQQ